jgi:anti-sigma factor RsiW
MNCRDVEGLLGAYVDRELDLVRSLEVEKHLDECAACATAVQRHRALRSAVVEGATYYAAPESLRRKVRAISAPKLQSPRAWWAAGLAAAAVAACVVAVVVTRPHEGSVEQQVVAAHVRSLQANHLVDVPSSDRHTVKPWFAGKLDFAPQVNVPAGFELVGGRLDYLDGRPVAALIYRRQQHTINVFTWPGAAGDRGPRFESENGFQMVHWARGGMHWWAISDLGREELAEIVGQA